MEISIIGAGAWGTAVALSSFRAGHSITLITKSREDADEINGHQENITFFPGIKIPSAIRITHEYTSLASCDVLFLICPSSAIDDVCLHIKTHAFRESTPILSFCKGLPGSTWELPSMYIRRHFPEHSFGVLSGPSYAREVALDFPTQLVLASVHNGCKDVPISFSNMTFQYSDDVIGVELGGCLKNIYAIGAGMCDGLQFGDNGKCSYISACLREMVEVGVSLGAQAATFFGPSGLGDLLATSWGTWSRNRGFGETITKNNNPQEIVNRSVAAIEGYRSAKTFHNIFQEKGINAPIVEAIYGILYGQQPSVDQMKGILLEATFRKTF
ncbi:MAG: NAD(P)H-dependent glycerol-3-phosphate dehydrogenase [Puniceicoccales bacterium]|jgi:glycerol-3-phosphate dehydrogenase (NAD(P)+)|nr:NAD(P)H-dependent glycerol-3-phosphate dehydrogenase [Puniceicoccales bacterium]